MKISPRVSGNLAGVIASLAAVALPFFFFGFSLTSRLLGIVFVCLVLWLLELVPPFVPTLLLLVLIPLALSPLDPQYSFANALRWAADPVLALFFGGFALGVAAERSGLSAKLARYAISRSAGRFAWMLALTMALCAFMSMWLSNIAAAALMFGALRPMLACMDKDDASRRALLVGTAFAANIGGIATPVGTGPNAIAIASVSGSVPISFIDWMMFALPLTTGLLLVAYALLWWKVKGEPGELAFSFPAESEKDGTGENGSGRFFAVLTACVLFWLSEPIHGISAPIVALSAASALFLFGSLRKDDLRRIDWSTLLLIAGGITLGRLIESSGLLQSGSEILDVANLDPRLVILVLCLASAAFSSLMSNTATVVMLIPIATALNLEPFAAILIAISASFGMVFVVSTPQNAMAYGEGGVRASDFFYPGLVVIVIGCVLVVLTGRFVLNLVGIP